MKKETDIFSVLSIFGIAVSRPLAGIITIAVVSDRIIGRKLRNYTSHELIEKRDGNRHLAMRWTKDHPFFYQVRPGRL